MPWDGYGNALYAQAHGFETYHKPVEGSLVNYENLDNVPDRYPRLLQVPQVRIRPRDRPGLPARPTRPAPPRRGDPPRPPPRRDVSLGLPRAPRSQEVLDDIDMSLEEFVRVCDRFTNKKLFVCDARGELVKDRRGNLTKVNYDNVQRAETRWAPPGPREPGRDRRLRASATSTRSPARSRIAAERRSSPSDPADLGSATRIVLPGVGAFADAMARLRARGLDEALAEQVTGQGIPFLGICLGMQLLATRGTEGARQPASAGSTARSDCLTIDWRERIPHIGWNEVEPTADSPLFDGIAPERDFYFVHSYVLRPSDDPKTSRPRPRTAAASSRPSHRGQRVRRPVPPREEPAGRLRRPPQLPGAVGRLVLKVRIMPTLLYKDLGLVKGVRFDSWRRVGSAMQTVKVYNLREVDELVFLDIAATLDGRGPDLAAGRRAGGRVLHAPDRRRRRAHDRGRSGAAHGRRGQGLDQHRRPSRIRT